MDQQQNNVPVADRDLAAEGPEEVDYRHGVDPIHIRDDVDSVHVWAESLNRDVMDIEDHTFEQAAAYLAKLREAVRLLRDSEAAIEEWLAKVWKDQRMSGAVTVSGVGTIEVKRGGERKEWDHDGAAKAVVHALIEGKGGELPGPFEVRDALLKAGYVGYWRKGGMKALGLEADDFCTVVPGVRRVIIT